MPYYGYNGEEIEDPEMDEMRREAEDLLPPHREPKEVRKQTMRTSTQAVRAASIMLARLAAVEAKVAQLRLDLADLDGRLQNRGVVLATRIGALEAQVDTATERLETRLEGLSDRLEERLERASRDLEGRIYDVERRLERSAR